MGAAATGGAGVSSRVTASRGAAHGVGTRRRLGVNGKSFLQGPRAPSGGRALCAVSPGVSPGGFDGCRWVPSAELAILTDKPVSLVVFETEMAARGPVPSLKSRK